jgi:hypothetical protein
LAVVVVVLHPSPVHAQSKVVLSVRGELPCSERELEEAVALRVPAPGADRSRAIPVAIDRSSAQTVVVGSGAKRRQVWLGDRRGAAAARQMALAVADLVAADPEPLLGPRLVQGAAERRHPSDPAGPALVLSVGPTLAAGSRFDAPAMGGELDASLRLSGPLRATLGAGVAIQPEATAQNATLGLVRLPVRLGLGLCGPGWPLELRLGAVISPYWASGRAGSDSFANQGLMAGATAGLVYVRPLLGALAVSARLGLDAFATEDEYRVGGRFLATTARLVVWAGVGLSWEAVR